MATEAGAISEGGAAASDQRGAAASEDPDTIRLLRGDQVLFSLNPHVWSQDLAYVSAQTAFGLLPWLAMMFLRHGGPAPPPNSLQVTGAGAGLLSYAFQPSWLRFTNGDPEAELLYFEQVAASAAQAAGKKLTSRSTQAMTAWATLFPDTE